MSAATIEPMFFGRGANRILYDAQVLPAVSLEWLQPAFWEIRQAVTARLGGRGQALAIDTDLGPAVLRRYRRGGLVAPVLEDRYLFTGYVRSRAFREWFLLRELCAEGLPVPRPLAASCERSGLVYRAGLLTVQISGARVLADIAGTLSPLQWQALADTLASFFAAGVIHPDLNARNLLLDEAERWYLIDFDRARRSRAPTPGGPMIRRLMRSFERLGIQPDRRFLSQCRKF